MKIYKISFFLNSPISFTVLPTFDSILAWCLLKEKYGYVEQLLNIKSVDNFSELPIIRHEKGYFLASWMQYNKDECIEYNSSWKKRWDNQHDSLVDFRGKVKKIRTNAGNFKPYNMPIVLKNVKKVWFYVASDDIDRIRMLVSNNLYGIGKKTSQGYGEIEGFEVERIDYNPFEEIIRPIPIERKDIVGNVSVRLMGYKPPYWLAENQTFCIMPNNM